MATDEALLGFTAKHAVFPASNAATFDERNDHLLLDFAPSSDEEAHFTGWLPDNYGASGIDVIIKWAATTATSGNVKHETSFERVQAGVTDLDTASFATAKTSTVATDSTSGVTTHTTIAHSNGSEIDGLLKNEYFRLKYRRLGSDAADTMAGDMELQGIYLRET
jgi:hypothetical protein